MRFTFDTEEVHLSSLTTNAIKTFMLMFLRDMQESPHFDKECWTWGLATIKDFSCANSIDFQWGGDDDIPKVNENQLYVHI